MGICYNKNSNRKETSQNINTPSYNYPVAPVCESQYGKIFQDSYKNDKFNHYKNDQRQINQNERFYDINDQRQIYQNERFYDKNERFYDINDQRQIYQNERFYDKNDQRQINQNERFYDKNDQRQINQNEGFYIKNDQRQINQNEGYYYKNDQRQINQNERFYDKNDQRQINQNERFYDKNDQRQINQNERLNYKNNQKQTNQNEGFYNQNDQRQINQNEGFNDKKQYDEIERKDKNEKIQIFNNKRDKASSFEFSEKYENTFQKHQNLSMKQNMKGMYDIIFACESLDKLIEKNNGWNYYYSERYKNLIQSKEKKNEKYSKIGFIGETNKGKTFILNQLTGNELKSGEEFKTEGLSCKFTDFGGDGDKFMIFDSAGRSEPLLIDESSSKDATKNLLELKKEVERKSRDLKFSEKFLRDFIINNSNIIILVVNQLTLSEQKSLYQLKTEKNFEEIFILHNLCNFYERGQIEDYVDKTIINSMYFNLRKNYFEPKDISEETIDLPYYFVEEKKENNITKFLICHLITGNIETSDKWVENLNKKTLEHLKNEIQVKCKYKGHFLDIKDLLEEELKNKDIINKDGNEHLTKEKETVEIYDGFKMNKGILKLPNYSGKLSKDNYNFTGFNNGFIPPYIYYQKENKFVIEVECSGEEDKEMTIQAKKKTKIFFSKLKAKKFIQRVLKRSLYLLILIFK
jgi:hypothetical protein